MMSILKNFGLYAILVSIIAYYYYSTQSLEKANNDLSYNLQGVLGINESLTNNIKQMRDDFNNQLQAVSEAQRSENNITKRVESVKHENNQSNPDNIIKRFNFMLDRLYE